MNPVSLFWFNSVWFVGRKDASNCGDGNWNQRDKQTSQGKIWPRLSLFIIVVSGLRHCVSKMMILNKTLLDHVCCDSLLMLSVVNTFVWIEWVKGLACSLFSGWWSSTLRLFKLILPTKYVFRSSKFKDFVRLLKMLRSHDQFPFCVFGKNFQQYCHVFNEVTCHSGDFRGPSLGLAGGAYSSNLPDIQYGEIDKWGMQDESHEQPWPITCHEIYTLLKTIQP
ncbi:unnamed protein product [Ambrosiozyma monospora]|uniref:Unnamed protein product n=1 Tax=Ambrosiozyma monospora TaxID=43982 RepID=A0ACB5U8G6_AMBMO|nr:unnamed protein product [Ambrosiozyma monospora]